MYQRAKIFRALNIPLKAWTNMIIDQSSTSISEAEKADPNEDDLISNAVLIEVEECDIVVHMPPKRRYSIELDIKSITKAKPKFIEPEPI